MADGSEESINTKKTLIHALSEYSLAIKHTGELLNWKPTICKPWLNARERFNHCPVNTITPGKLPEQFGGVAWLDVTYSVAGGDLFGGSTWLNQI